MTDPVLIPIVNKEDIDCAGSYGVDSSPVVLVVLVSLRLHLVLYPIAPVLLLVHLTAVVSLEHVGGADVDQLHRQEELGQWRQKSTRSSLTALSPPAISWLMESFFLGPWLASFTANYTWDENVVRRNIKT